MGARVHNTHNSINFLKQLHLTSPELWCRAGKSGHQSPALDVHGVNYFLDPRCVNQLEGLYRAIILSPDDGNSAVGAAQLLALQCFLYGRQGILDELLRGVVLVALESALKASLGGLTARTNSKCLVLKVIPTGAVIIEMRSCLVQSGHKEPNTLRPLP